MTNTVPAPNVIPLPNHFVQLQLGALKEIVDHHLGDDNSGGVQFDASELVRMDGAAAQFLCAVSRMQAGEGPEPLVINANEIVFNALTDMGLIDRLTIAAPLEQAEAA